MGESNNCFRLFQERRSKRYCCCFIFYFVLFLLLGPFCRHHTPKINVYDLINKKSLKPQEKIATTNNTHTHFEKGEISFVECFYTSWKYRIPFRVHREELTAIQVYQTTHALAFQRTPTLRLPETGQTRLCRFAHCKSRSRIPCRSVNMALPTITFVTGNENKLREVQQILGAGRDNPPRFDMISRKLDLPELQGEPEDIARQKCKLAAQHVAGPTLVEDTGLCFNALKGLPGPYIKWFLDKIGHDGLNKMLIGFEDKSGYAICTFAYSSGKEGEVPTVFTGKTSGTIVPARAAPDRPAFGWDPIFQPEGFDLTYAEMDKATKNMISHRYKALVQVRNHLGSLLQKSQ